MKERNKNIKRIVFYTSIPRIFRSVLIGNLYQAARTYPVILLSEKLDKETERIIRDKEIFPKIEKIIPVHQHTGKKRNIFLKNRYLFKLAKDVINKYKPDIVITANDVYPFELYLLRFSKKIGALNLCFQGGFLMGTQKEISKMFILRNAYLMKIILPFPFKIFLAKLKKQLGHFLFYWIMPLLVGEKPFIGKSSFIFFRKKTGKRDGDYYLVWTKRDFDLSVKSGLPKENVFILSHPFARDYKEVFKKNFSEQFQNRIGKKILTLMLPCEKIGIKKDDLSLISEKEIEKDRKEILSLISKNLWDWQIFIKPHPEIESVEKEKKIFESISSNIKVVEPQEPADKYIEMSRVIVGVPPASTTLFTAFLQDEKKIILSLDFNHELLGDSFKEFDGIEYIDSKEKFINILKLIKENRYYKKNEKIKKDIGFSNAVLLINYLWNKKYAKK